MPGRPRPLLPHSSFRCCSSLAVGAHAGTAVDREYLRSTWDISKSESRRRPYRTVQRGTLQSPSLAALASVAATWKFPLEPQRH